MGNFSLTLGTRSQKKFIKFEEEMRQVFQLLGQRQQKLKKSLLGLSRQKVSDCDG